MLNIVKPSKMENITIHSEEAFVALINQLILEIRELDTKFNHHHATYQEGTEKAIHKAMSIAFPDADPDGHRRHHEAIIIAAEKRAKFWEKMREELAKYGLLGFVGWAIYELWKAFLMGPK